MSKEYVLTLSRDYCSDWSVVDAIREVIQNGLDSPETFEYEVGDSYINLTSKNTQLPSSSLILGVSGKRNDSNALGGFGEGFKIACLIFCREGIDVVIRNGNKVWTPELKWNSDYETDMLTITETEGRGNDLTFEICNLDKSDIEQAIENCLYMQEDLGNYVTAPCGSRIFYDIPHKLYVGGLFVTDTQLQFSYDLHPSKIKLNRDRSTIDGWDLQGVTARILASVTNEPEFLERVVGVARTGGNDTYHMKYYSIPEGSEEVAYKQFKESYGEDKIVATDWTDREDLIKKGYDEENIVVVSQDAYAKMIKQCGEYQEFLETLETEEVEVDERSPVEILEEFIEKYEYYIDSGADVTLDKIIKLFNERGVSWDDNKPHRLDSIPF